MHVVITTDGTIRDDVTAWGVAARNGRSSRYRSECEAIGDAVVWMTENTTHDDRVAVLTDSLSIVSRLEKHMMMSTWWDSIRVVKAHIICVYVPGHSGITYNEKADKLAGEATVFGDLVHEPDDVIKEMEARLIEQESAVQQESWSVVTTDGKRVNSWRWKEVRGEGMGKKPGKSSGSCGPFYEYSTEAHWGRRTRASASVATPLLRIVKGERWTVFTVLNLPSLRSLEQTHWYLLCIMSIN
jgi:ribonuclease HI